ncbi:MAG: cytochrome c3 family protein [Bacillota bacterium]
MPQKLLVVMITLIIILLTGTAAAWAGGPHGNYTIDTGTCGQCHNTHAATGTNLIANLASGSQNFVYRVCVYCHKSGGQSKYDVVNGAVSSTKTSNAGGFTNTYIEGTGSVAISSKHDVDSSQGATFWAPGYSSAAENLVELTCASCHDPHSGSDRAFRSSILGIAVTPAMSMTVSSGDESIRYESGWNEFCGACHKDFLQTNAGSGDASSGTYSLKKRHRVDMDPGAYAGVSSTSWTRGFLSQPSIKLPLENNSDDGSLTQPKEVSCMTCHFAHSSTKTNTLTFNRTDGSTRSSSALLRMDNRGVCEACHNK